MRLALLANPDNIHVQRWVKFLAGRDHEILLIADPHTRSRPEGIQIEIPRWNLATNILAFRLTPKPHGNALWKALHYRPIIAKFRPDVVHGFEAYYNGLATAWAGPYPKVLTPWGMDIHRDAVAGGLSSWIVQRALRGVHFITTNDETVPDYLNERFGIPKERVEPFSWGVDVSTFKQGLKVEADELRRRLDIAPGSPVLLSPRNFDPYWGAETFIDSLPNMFRNVPSAIAVILASTASPQFVREMKSRAVALGVAEKIRWIELWQSSQEMAALYNLADAFVSIPKTDLLAMTILEGMACGCLPVVAPLPAYSGRLRDGENAAFVKPVSAQNLANIISRALSDADFRSKAAAINIDLIAREENASVNMAKIEGIYEKAIEAFRSSR